MMPTRASYHFASSSKEVTQPSTSTSPCSWPAASRGPVDRLWSQTKGYKQCDKFVSHADAATWLKANRGVMRIVATIQPVGQLVAKPTAPAEEEPPRAPLPACVPTSSLPGDMRALLNSGDNADCTLVCGGERIRAHTLILSVASPVFKAQLDRRNPLACANLSHVTVPADIQPPVLLKLLDYAYTDEGVRFNDVDEARMSSRADVVCCCSGSPTRV